MMIAQRVLRIATATAALGAASLLGGCAQTGGLGNILGGVLAPQNGMQVSATVQSVDTRSQTINLNQSNGQYMSVYFDNSTRVLYQNQLYPVTSLEFGDQVLAHVLNQGNNSYYADTVYVTQPVNSSSNPSRYERPGYPGSNTNIQTLSGRVQSIDFNNGSFTINDGNGTFVTVSMPYRASSQDQNRFNNLRVGDFVRFSGALIDASRAQLQHFY